MDFRCLEIPDVKIIVPRKVADGRGFFSETYSEAVFLGAGLPSAFVQDNHSLSRRKWTVRGLHFQVPPHAQGKLVRVCRGSILDVAVDLRRRSPTFGRHVTAVLSAANWAQLWVPMGFAHGFCTLEPDTEVIYKVTDYYTPTHDRGLKWDDKALGIAWPIGSSDALLSAKDAQLPSFRDLPCYFE
jgi:dTDP-4-dehydrorhamnose 3,5-epimerase